MINNLTIKPQNALFQLPAKPVNPCAVQLKSHFYFSSPVEGEKLYTLPSHLGALAEPANL